MNRTARNLVAATALLATLFALHVQLNLGGWQYFLARVGKTDAVRGELVVGFLPVT